MAVRRHLPLLAALACFVGLVVAGVLALALPAAHERDAAMLHGFVGLDRPSVHRAIWVVAHLGDTLPYACAGAAVHRRGAGPATGLARAGRGVPAGGDRRHDAGAQARAGPAAPRALAARAGRDELVAQRALDRRHDPRPVRRPRGPAGAAGGGRDARRRLRRRRGLRGPRPRLALPVRRARRVPRRRAVDVAGRRRAAPRRGARARRPSAYGSRWRAWPAARVSSPRSYSECAPTPWRSTPPSARPSPPARSPSRCSRSCW